MGSRMPAQLLRMPTRRESVPVLAGAALVAVICWYFGVDVWHSILLACAITVITLVANAAAGAPAAPHDVEWHPHRKAANDGSRSDVARLSTALRGGWGFVGPTAERQLRMIARGRLALEGLDLANPAHQAAIERLIGASTYRILRRQGSRRLRMRTLIRCLDALDASNSAYYPQPQRSGLAPDPTASGRIVER